MRSIDVAFGPREARPSELAVVVDVLRASSTMVAALEAGFGAVICTATAERARELAGSGRLLAGESGCLAIEGFDRGNSPVFADGAGAEELVLCTTNGTPALLGAVSLAHDVLVGALVNLEALIEAIPADAEVTVICAGRDHRFALEDAYAAGRIVERLSGQRSDAARAAERLAGSYGDGWTPLSESAGGGALRATAQVDDIDFCARESIFSAVPVARPGPDDTAVVTALETYRDAAMQTARSFT